jgi:hypothetical protein
MSTWLCALDIFFWGRWGAVGGSSEGKTRNCHVPSVRLMINGRVRSRARRSDDAGLTSLTVSQRQITVNIGTLQFDDEEHT